MSLIAVVASAHAAFAQPKSEAVPLLGAAPVLKATASTGFVDDVVASDGDRFAYVVADSTTQAALHVATVNKDGEQIVDISTITLQPLALQFVGQRMLVLGASNDGKQVGALVDLANGKTIYKLPPADHLTIITRDGKPRVAAHRTTESAGVTKHSVDIFAIDNGKRTQAGKSLALDAAMTDAKLQFRVDHWSDGWTRAYGIKVGEWDKKEDQRAPDQEATFDLVTGKLDKQAITDLFDQKRRFAAHADAGGKLDFLRLVPDGIQIWHAGRGRTLELDQPFGSYDAKTLQFVLGADGTGWLALKVDPVNAEAVARKKADPEYLDIFKVPAEGKAVRKARVMAKGVRYRFGVAGDRFWLQERNAGFERGGKLVTLYQLQ